MADLRVDFVGLKLKNPLIVSSAGITENLDKMRLCQEHGAAENWRLLRYDVGHQETPQGRREILSFLKKHL